MASNGKTVTIRDIARGAGVSPGAVSFVLNNTHEERRISEPTVERVRQVAKELGYIPNIAARNLRFVGSKRNLLLLAIITADDSPLTLVSHIFDGLQRCLRRDTSGRHFVINIITFQPGRLREVPGLLDGSLFNAALITNTLPEDDAFLERTTLPYPSMVIGREIDRHSYFVPSQNSGKVAARALIESKANRPAVLYNKHLTQATQSRVQQFSEEVDAILGVEAALIVCGQQNERSAYQATKKALGKESGLDSIYAVHDSFAAGAYLAIKEKGLRIPQDMKVIGVGDSEIAPYLDPPLSSAGAEESRVYEKAASMMLDLIENPSQSPKRGLTRARFASRGSV